MVAALLGLVGVLFAAALAVFGGYWYKRKEHLRELRVEIYSELLLAAESSLFAQAGVHVARNGRGGGALLDFEEAEAMAAATRLANARGRFQFVASADAWEAFLPIHDGLEQIDLSEEVSDEEIQASLAAIAPANNWFAYVTGRELWGRREIPAPLATAR